MNKKDAQQRINKLKKEINHHRYLYHVLNTEEISEGALDSLKKELADLEQEYPDLISEDSPTQRVAGVALDKFEKIEHSERMISLFDSFSHKDVLDWEVRAKKKEPDLKSDYFCELKLDGIAGAIRYKKSNFQVGITRGNGKVGEDVSSNLRTIDSIPLTLRIPTKKELANINFSNKEIENIQNEIKNGKIEIRGEIIMPLKSFVKLNKKLKKEGMQVLANPRNSVAGSIRQLNPKIVAERGLDFYAYELISNINLKTQEQKMNLLKLLGVKVLNNIKLCKNLKEVFKFRDYWANNKKKLPFEIDGIVVKINKLKYWQILGIVGKGPRYMMAYKFPAKQVSTIVKDVIWQIGRTGVLTPVAILDKTQVCGVIVGRATLHNMDEINRLGLMIGDTVIFERAGDVIPKIIKVLKNLRSGKEKKIEHPTKCPICGGDVKKKEGEVAYKCTNSNCYAVNRERLIYWASKNAMDINGLGKKVVDLLMKNGLVSDVSDFYKLKYEDLLFLDGFAEKSAKKLINAVHAKKNITLAKFIYGLGIKFIGEENAILLSTIMVNELKLKKNITIKKISQYFKEKSVEDLENIKDIGPVASRNIISWFSNKQNIILLNKLEELGIKIVVDNILLNKNNKFNGKKFVITGTLKDLTRNDVKNKIRELGGNVSSAISGKVDYLIVGDKPGSKIEKAKKVGVKVINEKFFLEMIK